MGTRNLSLCKNDGNIVIAQYGQWDGYPSGQGVTILEFCLNSDNLTRLKAEIPNIRDINILTEFIEEYDNLCADCMGKHDSRTKQMKYWADELLSRDIGGCIFNNIINLDKSRLPQAMNNLIYLKHYEDIDKTKNYCDLWIEYAYLINFDTNELECYGDGNLLKSYSLDNLPTAEQFVKDLESEE